jgi:hypothetical protein
MFPFKNQLVNEMFLNIVGKTMKKHVIVLLLHVLHVLFILIFGYFERGAWWLVLSIIHKSPLMLNNKFFEVHNTT